MRSYSRDLRVRVIAAVDNGEKRAEVARRFDVTLRTIVGWLALRKQTGDLKPRSAKRGPKPKLEDRREEILLALREDPNLTLEEIKTRLELPCCLQTIWNALFRWGIRLKKSHSSRGTAAT